MRAAAYVRVSSLAQDAASQRDAVERAAQARGDQVARWYSSRGRAVARVIEGVEFRWWAVLVLDAAHH
jgi:DNA invertase Pin-like site-specific DNA recombinase